VGGETKNEVTVCYSLFHTLMSFSGFLDMASIFPFIGPLSRSLPVVAIRIVHQSDHSGQTFLVDNNDLESENGLSQYNLYTKPYYLSF